MSELKDWLIHWEKYYKKIPKRGLNNLTREDEYWKRFHPDEEWKGKPTLPRRMEKLQPFLGSSGLPFYYLKGDIVTHLMFKGTSPEEVEEILREVKTLTNKIIVTLQALHAHLDFVTVLPPDQVEDLKHGVKFLIALIRKESMQLKVIQEADYEVIES